MGSTDTEDGANMQSNRYVRTLVYYRHINFRVHVLIYFNYITVH